MTAAGALIVADYSAEYPGAFIRSIEALGRALAAEHSVAFLFPRERDWHTQLNEVGPVLVSRCSPWGRVSGGLTQEILGICGRHGISLVHTNFGSAAPLGAAVARRVLGVAHVWHWRNPPNTLGTGRDHHGTLRSVAPVLYRSLGSGGGVAHVAISSGLADTLANHGYVASRRISVVYNAIDCELFDACTAIAAGRIGDIDVADLAGRPIVGFVGRFGPQKDHETFLHALALVKQRVANVAALLVGGALECELHELRKPLLRQISQLGLENNAWLVGQHDPIAPVIRLFDVGVLSSHWEGLGNATLEYMAMRKPVVATRVGGIPEVVVNGETGYLVAPACPAEMADRLLELLGNSGLRSRMGAAGRRRVEEEFSLERWVRSMLNVYSELGPWGGSDPRATEQVSHAC
jgi:glycosyltransferase involved in cell wall biosynthesis